MKERKYLAHEEKAETMAILITAGFVIAALVVAVVATVALL